MTISISIFWMASTCAKSSTVLHLCYYPVHLNLLAILFSEIPVLRSWVYSVTKQSHPNELCKAILSVKLIISNVHLPLFQRYHSPLWDTTWSNIRHSLILIQLFMVMNQISLKFWTPLVYFEENKITCIFQTDEPSQLYSNSISGLKFHMWIITPTGTMTIVQNMRPSSSTINSPRRQNTVALWQKHHLLGQIERHLHLFLWRCTRMISDCAS